MASIRPAYLNLQDLSEDSLTLAEHYLNEIDLENYTVKELTQLAPVLIDLLVMTHSEPMPGSLPTLKYRVHSTALALISDCINELESIRGLPELTRNSDYVSTMRILGKLHKAAEEMAGHNFEQRLEIDLTSQDLMTLGLTNDQPSK